MPALDLVREVDLVPSQLGVGLVVVRDKGQEGLLGLPLETIAVGLEVVGQEDPVIVLEVSVKSGQDLAEGVLFLAVLNGEVLKQSPYNTLNLTAGTRTRPRAKD